MALARIVTRSEACSRELAIDLLGRGYTVEIVSPDSVPPHRADLELRVDAGSGGQLVANVVARDGDRSASLDFVRDLRAQTIFPFPTLPVNREAVRLTEDLNMDSANAANGHKPEIKLNHDDGVRPVLMPSLTPSFSEPFSGDILTASSKIARAPAQPLIAKRNAAAWPTTSALPAFPNKTAPSLRSTPMEVAATPVTIARPPAPPIVAPQIMQHSMLERTPSRFGMIAACLTSVALLVALIFGFSPHRTDVSTSTATSTSEKSLSKAAQVAEPTTQSDAALATQLKGRQPTTTVKATAKPAVTKVPGEQVAAATLPSKAPSSTLASKATGASKASSTHGRGESLIARDTVVYLEKPAKKLTDTKPAPLASRTRAHRSGEVAENTVTYLNGMTAPSANAVKPVK